MMTIHFGHAIDYIQHGKYVSPIYKPETDTLHTVLGYGFTSSHALLANRRTTTKLTNADGKILDEKHPITADDTIFLQGMLSSGIPLSYSLRGGPKFKDVPGLDWRIYGETGEIRLTATGPFLQIGYPDMKIEVSLSFLFLLIFFKGFYEKRISLGARH